MHDEGDAPVAVRQLRAALSREFAGLIDMTDFSSATPDRLRERAPSLRGLWPPRPPAFSRTVMRTRPPQPLSTAPTTWASTLWRSGQVE